MLVLKQNQRRFHLLLSTLLIRGIRESLIFSSYLHIKEKIIKTISVNLMSEMQRVLINEFCKIHGIHTEVFQ